MCTAGAGLACLRAEAPIVPADPKISTPLAVPPTFTATVASPTPVTPEVPTITPEPSSTPEASATPGATIVPIPNGTFDTDLNGWTIIDPPWGEWQDGYARVNASDNIGGAFIAQIVQVPDVPAVRLHFRHRSEDALGSDCLVEVNSTPDVNRAILLPLPQDNIWRDVELDLTPQRGTEITLLLKAKNNGACHWLHFDDVYWVLLPATEAAASPTPAATSTATPVPTAGAIPADATLIQEFGVAHEGGTLVGRASDIADGQTITWASLRGGDAAWILSLGSSQNVVGLRLYPHHDGEDTTLRLIEVSSDGTNWAPVYAGDGNCAGVPACDILAQETWVDLAFGPFPAQFVRLRGGPTRFALAEIQVAVVP